ncbi:hypothetical protein GQ44DRAFT_217699 [Phaeosphaeriaceae sp. PMI808]|nr:hypothetical protein GQ44DRAFT_217699 [Phaeosphaeriaceae sp. PMI808]
MSSYGSTRSGYLHPSQYPPNPPQQHQQSQPPYPTTPDPSTNPQPQPFYPPHPHQKTTHSTSPTHQIYSSSPQQGYFSTPTSQPFYHQAQQQQQPSQPPPLLPQHTRRTSSFSHQNPPPFPPTAPIQIPAAQFQQPVYARDGSHSSHYSHHGMHNPHTWVDGEDKHEQGHAGLDEDTLRQYEKRYAKDRELERRPTLGGSLMTVVKALGGKRG